MTKEQFLAMSLPYGLKVTLNQKGKFNLDEDYPQPHDEVCSVVDVIIGKPFKYEIADGNIGYGYIEEDEFDILLHPLSDLTKEIEHEGEKFVPIVELAKMEELLEPISFNTMDDFSRGQRGVCAHDRFNNQWLMFSFDCGFSLWHKPHESPEHRPTLLNGNQLDLFQKLISWHFDICGLLEKGDAIDVNTLDKNPYA